MQKSHLETNAQPIIDSILAATDELRDACNLFCGTNDNRVAIETWAQKIQASATELLEVRDEDSVAVAASTAFQLHHTRLLAALRGITMRVSAVYSDEDGTNVPLKRLRRAVAAARERTQAYSETKDNRADIAKSLEAIKVQVADILTIDETMDRWPANQLTDACDAYLRILKEPIPTGTAPTPEPREVNRLAQRIANEIDDLVIAVAGMSSPLHGGRSEALALLAQVQSLRHFVLTKLWEAFSDDDIAEMMRRLKTIEADNLALVRIRSEATQEPGFMRDGVARVAPHVANVIRLIPTTSDQPRPKTLRSLLAPIARGFGWEDSAITA